MLHGFVGSIVLSVHIMRSIQHYFMPRLSISCAFTAVPKSNGNRALPLEKFFQPDHCARLPKFICKCGNPLTSWLWSRKTLDIGGNMSAVLKSVCDTLSAYCRQFLKIYAAQCFLWNVLSTSTLGEPMLIPQNFQSWPQPRKINGLRIFALNCFFILK